MKTGIDEILEEDHIDRSELTDFLIHEDEKIGLLVT